MRDSLKFTDGHQSYNTCVYNPCVKGTHCLYHCVWKRSHDCELSQDQDRNVLSLVDCVSLSGLSQFYRMTRSRDMYLSFGQNGYLPQREILPRSILIIISGEDFVWQNHCCSWETLRIQRQFSWDVGRGFYIK